MQSILIVEPSDTLRTELEKELKKDFLVHCCMNADEGLRLISEHHPDALLLNLRLPGIDGLTFLENMELPRPSVVITLSSAYSPSVEQRLLDLGVAYPLLAGCSVRTIAHHIRSFLEIATRSIPPSAQQTVSSHLQILGVPRYGGFDDLRVGTPLFAQDPAQSMVKEFYPAVAELRGRDNWQQVEKAIRAAKEYAYAHRRDAIWQEYFPDTSSCPRNKEFIARLAEFIK